MRPLIETSCQLPSGKEKNSLQNSLTTGSLAEGNDPNAFGILCNFLISQVVSGYNWVLPKT